MGITEPSEGCQSHIKKKEIFPSIRWKEFIASAPMTNYKASWFDDTFGFIS